MYDRHHYDHRYRYVEESDPYCLPASTAEKVITLCIGVFGTALFIWALFSML